MEISFGASFGANQTPVNAADETAANAKATQLERAVVPLPSTPVPAVANDPFALGDFLPGFNDIRLPSINIVQGTGELKDTFSQGALVFDQKLEIYRMPIIDKATGNIKVAGTPPVILTVLGFRPSRFVEKIEGGSRGMLVNTEAEVRAAGGTLDYNEWLLKKSSGMKRFETLATAFVILRRPEHVADDGTIFTFDIGGQNHVLAVWNMKGSSYTQCAKKVFFTARKMGNLAKGGYPSWSYAVSTRTESRNGNTYYVPVAIPNAPSTPAMLEFVRGILTPTAAAE